MLRSNKEEIENLLTGITLGHEEGEKIINEKRAKLGDEAFFETARRIMLYTNDTLWIEHLEAMDYLRSSVNLRAYGQREPIVEYKKDGLAMFKDMEQAFKEQALSLLQTIDTEKAAVVKREDLNEPRQTIVTNHSEPLPNDISASYDSKVGRNDPCPCGAINPATGEVYKWKKCGMINAPQHRKSLVS
jgi:preprotein translocase subunit SecA